MFIRTVTIGFGRTVSMEGYENVKPSITLTADLDSTDDAELVIASLAEWALAHVDGQIDDVLESNGEPPRYTTLPLFKVHVFQQAKAVVVVPREVKIGDLPGSWDPQLFPPMRYPATIDRARAWVEGHEGYGLWNCSVGDVRRHTLAWWHRFDWYTALGFVSPGTPGIGQILCFPWGSAELSPQGDLIDRGLLRLRGGLSREPFRLQDLDHLLQDKDYGGLPWHVVDSEEHLDRLHDEWAAAPELARGEPEEEDEKEGFTGDDIDF